MQTQSSIASPEPYDESTAERATDELDLIDTETACAIVGGKNKPVHRSTLWRLVKLGKLPPPNKKLRRWNRRPFVAAVRAILEEGA
jgi:hypothetical protein